MQLSRPVRIVAFAAVASAASSSDSCSYSSTKITAATAVSQLASCPTLDGNIEIGGDGLGALDFGQVKEIKGDLKLFNSSTVTNVNFNNLETISGSLDVDAYTQLHGIDFTSLTTVNELSLVSLPSLAFLNLNKGISKADSIKVSDTALSSVQGLTNFNTVGYLDIDNNKNITEIDLGGLQTVTENLILTFNSDHCKVTLDDLQWASNLTVQDVAEFSASNLTSVNGTLNVGYNTFDSLDLSSLKTVGGSAQIFANDDLTKLDLSKLKTIGGELRMFNNTELEDLGDTFSSLEEVQGAVNIEGGLSNFSLPKIDKIDGDFTFTTTSDDFDCSALNKLHSKGTIEGHNYNCSAPSKSSSSSSSKTSSKSGSKSSDSSSSSGSSDSSSSSSSKKSDGNNAQVYGGVMSAACAVAAALAVIV